MPRTYRVLWVLNLHTTAIMVVVMTVLGTMTVSAQLRLYLWLAGGQHRADNSERTWSSKRGSCRQRNTCRKGWTVGRTRARGRVGHLESIAMEREKSRLGVLRTIVRWYISVMVREGLRDRQWWWPLDGMGGVAWLRR